MGYMLNPDNSGFKDAINGEIYVDKSELISFTNRVLSTHQKFICNSRPRRFGKSMTADMLASYYSKGCDSLDLFSNLKISQDPSFNEYLNKYNVVHFDLQWCIGQAKSVDNIIEFIEQNIINELKNEFKEVDIDESQHLASVLFKIYTETKSRFIIIIDEWDVLIRDNNQNKSIQDKYINFLRDLFKGTEPLKYIALAYLTGILPIKRIQTESALNNFEEFTMLDPAQFAPYIGFTENEVKNLCCKYNKNFNEVKKWYDGYLLNEEHIYNPKAVVSLMLRGKFKSYWSQTSSYSSVQQLIDMNFDGLKDSIIEMLSGNKVPVYTDSFQNDTISFANRDDVLTYLIHLGYLTFDDIENVCWIPNEEIRKEFVTATRNSKWNELIEFENQSTQLVNATLNLNEVAVAQGIEKIHREFASSIQYNDENSLSSVLSIAYLSTLTDYYKPIREMPTGLGFADFIYIPKKEKSSRYPALVVELKWNKDVDTAMNQIKEKKYPESLTQYTGNILLVAINYDKKTKEHQCKIETLEKS